MTRSGSGAAERFFDAIARRYDRVYAPDRDTSREKLARVLARLPANARVLDLGVGTGRELGALLDAGHAPTGLDVSEEMLEICGRRSRPVPLVRGDFWQPLPFDAGSFDAVLALHGTLAHPPEAAAYGRLEAELARVLGEDGLVVAEVPSPRWLAELPADGARAGDLRLRRTGPGACVHEDLVANVSLEVTVSSADEWRALFGSWRDVTVDEVGAELFIVARRR